jgi:tetratricopeptide (TPR) repeat protein
MRTGLLRVVSTLLFAPVAVSLSARLFAQGNGNAVPSGSAAQAADSSSKYALPGCTIDHTKPTDADMALTARKYADAERLYNDALTAEPNSSAARAGLVRTTLAEGKLPEALALAMKYSSAHPNDAVLLDALGEVRFRRGEVREAAVAFNQSSRIDGCDGQTHYDAAQFLNLSSLHASAQHELEVAHAQAPENAEITRAWSASHAVPQTPEGRIASLKKRLDNPSLNDEQKNGINSAIKGIESSEKGSCELVKPVAQAKVPILPISRDSAFAKETMYEAELELQIDGKKRKFEIDTGASGLLLTHAVAKNAGLVPEAAIKAGGIGDAGPVNAFVTHVDDIKIGPMEFKNCMVNVLPPGSTLDQVPDVDGLIGPDVFRDYLVTLDYPGFEMSLDPLPPRPGDTAKAPSLATSEDQAPPASFADSARDRYIAPEMKGWTPVFRSQHFLILPTLIGDAPVKLFVMDTGASKSMISPEAAREVAHITSFNDSKIQGLSGQVMSPLKADKIKIVFANISQVVNGMDSFDMSGISRSAGVDISGMIGFPFLSQLVISIDYRDSLVHVVYDPKKGFHATPTD